MIIVLHIYLSKGTITVSTATQDQANNAANKNFAPFRNCIGIIDNTQVDDAHVIHVVLPIYNLIYEVITI